MTVCLILVAVVFLLFWLFRGGDFSGSAEEEGETPQIARMVSVRKSIHTANVHVWILKM